VSTASAADIGPFTGDDIVVGSPVTVRADPLSGVVSVKFVTDGGSPWIESVAPYAIAGDHGFGSYAPWNPPLGSHTLVVTPYSKAGAGGTAGQSITVQFNVVDPTSDGTTIGDVTWKNTAPRSPRGRTEAGSIQVGSKLYVIGGFAAEGGTSTYFPALRKVDVYDLVTETWSALAPLPDEAGFNHFGLATDGENIYTISGQITDTYGTGTKTSWKYNIASDTWTQFVSLPEIRYGGTAFIVGNLLHFVDGDKADRFTDSNDHWAIDLTDPDAGWVKMTSTPLAVDHLTHATVNGRVLLIGGENGHEGIDGVPVGTYKQRGDVFEYLPETDTFVRRASLPVPTSHVEGATLVINDQIVIIGGLLDGGGTRQTNKVQVYNPATNTWKVLPSLFPKIIDGPESAYYDGRIYLTDGYKSQEADHSVGYEGTVKFI
jgi:N-acetylneuraminic acid mutarotase